MDDLNLLNKIRSLSEKSKKELDIYIQNLEHKDRSTANIRERQFGCAKGLLKMHNDFDEPLSDFDEYIYR